MSEPTVVPIPDDPLDLSGDPAPSDPIALFHTWFAIARERAGVPNSHAMAVATVDERGQPSVRKGVGQRAGVAELVRLVLGDLAQDAPHDLAAAGLRQARRPLDHVVGVAMGPISLRTCLTSSFFSSSVYSSPALSVT
jgi:hypothetical protein